MRDKIVSVSDETTARPVHDWARPKLRVISKYGTVIKHNTQQVMRSSLYIHD